MTFFFKTKISTINPIQVNQYNEALQVTNNFLAQRAKRCRIGCCREVHVDDKNMKG